ncbi:MAG TPA: glutathione S-transferase family protein [Microvirga sp.]|nr:glutathione S-transferase family protein [Microvirga sp.]
MPTLVIANKLYSSWSLRPWLLLRELGIAFDEIVIPLDTPTTKAEVLRHSPAGKVPILVDGDVTVWESIAIIEYAADAYGAPVWPADRKARAMARSVAAEMHAGFQALRSACPMNLGKKFARRDRGEAVARDVARFEGIVRDARERFGRGGPFLFGAFSGADAMYAPVVTRLETYSIPVSAPTRAYMDAILALPSFQDWRAAALQETWVVADDEVDEEPTEVYRTAA